MTSPLSLRLTDAALERLGERARRAGTRPRTLAQRYVEEGLRMDEHPLVRFVDGPAGRRARLVGTGKDVWEGIATVRDNGNDQAAAAEYLRIALGSSRRRSPTTARTATRSTRSSPTTSARPPKP